MPLAFRPVTDDELPIEVLGDYHRLHRAFERTGLGDVSGDRVSAKLYEQIHTIARNAAARRASTTNATTPVLATGDQDLAI